MKKYIINIMEKVQSGTTTKKDRLNLLWIYPLIFIGGILVNIACLTIIVPVGYYVITGRNYFDDFIDAPDGF